MNRVEFARYMRSAREKAGLSKFAAGKALGYISDGTINGVEQGRTGLPVEQIHPVSRLYGIPIDELLEKIKECEPNLYKKYLRLQEDIITHFAKQVAVQRSNSIDHGHARHHYPFHNGLFEQLTYSISYQNLKPMVQMGMDLRERKLHDRKQKILVFPHARAGRTKRIHHEGGFQHHQLRHAA